MIAQHTDIDAYLSDLAYAVQNEQELPTVRADIDVFEVNDGVSRLSVVSSFEDEKHYYELTYDCGEVWKGGKHNEAEQVAQDAINKIHQACEQLNIRFGGGRWQRV